MPGTRGLSAGKAVISLGLNTAQFDRGMRTVGNHMRNLRRTYRGLSFGGGFGMRGGMRGGMGMALPGLLTAGATGLGAYKALQQPIKLAMEYQKAEAEMRVFTDRAGSIVAQIQDMSRWSIVSAESMQKATNTLLGYGMAGDVVMETLRGLTEVARGSEDRLNRLALAMGQVTAKGLLYAQETRQFVEAGVNPIQLIAEETGLSVSDILLKQEQGQIPAEMVRAVLINTTREGGRFHKMLQSIANTARGQLSQAIANFNIAMTRLGQELLPTVTDALREVNTVLRGFADWMHGNTVAAWGFAKAMLYISAVSAGVIGVVGGLGVLSMFTGAVVMPLLMLISAFGIFTNAVVGALGFLLSLASAGGWAGVAGTLALAASFAYSLYEVVFRVQEAMLNAWDAAKKFASELWSDVLPAAQSVLDAIMIGDWDNAFSIMRVTWELAWEHMKGAAFGVLDAIRAEAFKLFAVLMKIWSEVDLFAGVPSRGRANAERAMELLQQGMQPTEGMLESTQRNNRISKLRQELMMLQDFVELNTEWDKELREAAEARRREAEKAELPGFLEPKNQRGAANVGATSASAGSRMIERMFGLANANKIQEKQLNEAEDQTRILNDIRTNLETAGIPVG